MTPNTTHPSDLCTTFETAEELRVSPRTIHRLISRGDLRRSSISAGRNLIPRSEIERLKAPTSELRKAS